MERWGKLTPLEIQEITKTRDYIYPNLHGVELEHGHLVGILDYIRPTYEMLKHKDFFYDKRKPTLRNYDKFQGLEAHLLQLESARIHGPRNAALFGAGLLALISIGLLQNPPKKKEPEFDISSLQDLLKHAKD